MEVGWRWETIEAGKQIDHGKQIVKHKHQSVDRSKNRKSVPRSWIHESKNGINDSLYFACHSWTWKIGHNNSDRGKEMDNTGSRRTEMHKSEAACRCTCFSSRGRGSNPKNIQEKKETLSQLNMNMSLELKLRQTHQMIDDRLTG